MTNKIENIIMGLVRDKMVMFDILLLISQKIKASRYRQSNGFKNIENYGNILFALITFSSTFLIIWSKKYWIIVVK